MSVDLYAITRHMLNRIVNDAIKSNHGWLILARLFNVKISLFESKIWFQVTIPM